jgi:hypothetical protein
VQQAPRRRRLNALETEHDLGGCAIGAVGCNTAAVASSAAVATATAAAAVHSPAGAAAAILAAAIHLVVVQRRCRGLVP